MFKNILWSPSLGKPYSEIDQDNPLRWYLLKEFSPGEYTKVSERWKCKDFMNEVVVCWNTGKKYYIYGFATNPDMLNKNADHLPFLLELSFDYATFENNISVVNDYLMEHGLAPVHVELWKDNLVFLALPLEALENTFNMSMYTLLVRSAHISDKVESWEELNKKAFSQDRKLLDTLKKKVPGTMPDTQKQYIVYCNDTYNIKHGDTDPSLGTGMVHNCGIQGWNSNKPTWE